MVLSKYAVLADQDHESYEFLSEGPKGTIKKIVKYQLLQPGVFNIAFGDWDEINQRIDDEIKSNNNDRDKVLATVASTVMDFIHHHPGSILFATGVTPSKTRLYQMGINQNWQEISRLLHVEGFIHGSWEAFKPGRNYEAFIVKAG